MNEELVKALDDFCKSLLESDCELQPFDGVFHIEGEYEPFIVPTDASMGDLSKMVAEKQEQLKLRKQFTDWIENFTQNNNELAKELLSNELKRKENESKWRSPHRIIVKNDQIHLELEDGSLKKLNLGRGYPGKTMYIFLLRQLERASENGAEPYCLSQPEMSIYKDELKKIHKNLSGKDFRGIDDLFLKGSFSNSFSTINVNIRNAFSEFFDVCALKYLTGKCYSIEIMGKDRYGNPRYGIDLDVEDFDLGWYSINRRKRQC